MLTKATLSRSVRALALTGLCFGLADSRDANAWSQHYLITDAVLEHPAITSDPNLAPLKRDRLQQSVKVESLDQFLEATQPQVSKLFQDYYVWLRARGSKRFKVMTFPATPTDGKANTAAFLRAARLNPSVKFPLGSRIFPGKKPTFKEVPAESLTPALASIPTFPHTDWVQRFEDVTGKTVSGHAILSTFSDEPDWGMDRGLFSIPEYGYGKIPYGKETGISSQAPFHMIFRNENFITKFAVPEILDGMGGERIELFKRLASLAFQSGHPYWGYRFSAWALHYIQDFSQPYHTRAVPHGGWIYTFKLAAAGEKKREKIKKDSLALVKNRHFIYEDVTAFAIQQSFLEPKESYKRIREALKVGLPAFTESRTMDSDTLVGKVSHFSAQHAPVIDEQVVELFDARMTQDPAYDLELDQTFSIRTLIQKIDEPKAKRLLDEIIQDHEIAGTASRSLLINVLPRE
jgi:hypothetical protein